MNVSIRDPTFAKWCRELVKLTTRDEWLAIVPALTTLVPNHKAIDSVEIVVSRAETYWQARHSKFGAGSIGRRSAGYALELLRDVRLRFASSRQ